jgi:predicted TIM-barrel fold metal-dependent hydrolase
MSRIDAHVHVWTDDRSDYPLAAGHAVEEMQPAHFTAEELLSHCRPFDVDRIVLVQMSFYGTDNSYMLDTMASYPGIFSGIAVIDPEAEGLERQMEHLGEQGVRGFRVWQKQHPGDGWLSGRGHQRLMAHAAQTRQAVCCLMDPDGLGELARCCEQYPDTSFVIDHACRIGSGVQIRDADLAALLELARYPRLCVKLSAFYALGGGLPHDDLKPLVSALFDGFGCDRLIWGSDCPYQVQDETYGDGLAVLCDLLSNRPVAEQEAVWSRTAARLFF